MFDTRDRILSQLHAGEDGRAEFKEVRLGDRGVISPDTEDLAGELVAFANAEGGVVFLGVDDSGCVRGIPPESMDTVENWAINVATHNCDPPIRPTLRKELLPGATGDDRRILCCVTTRTRRHTKASGNGMLPERPYRRRHRGGRPGDQGSPASGPVAGSALRRRARYHAMAGMLHHRRGVRGAPIMSVLAEAPRSLYVHRTSGGRYYLRVGSTKRDLTPPELARLFQERGREYVFDEQPVLTATVDDLNRNRLEAFFGRSPTIPWLDLLRNTRVTFRDEDGADRPTVAGLLAFGMEPTELLASGSIEAACYRGTRLSSDDLVHAERLAGPVSDQIDAGVAFVARFMQTPAGDWPGDRDAPSYDLDVVDEAIVNAVAHRDYAISGSKIRLFLFADRLELYSPGKLPNTITLDDMPYRTFTRNQLLVSFLSRLRSKRTGQVFLESRGEGVRKILQDGEAHSGRRPEYELFGDELRLTLWAKMPPVG